MLSPLMFTSQKDGLLVPKDIFLSCETGEKLFCHCKELYTFEKDRERNSETKEEEEIYCLFLLGDLNLLFLSCIYSYRIYQD